MPLSRRTALRSASTAALMACVPVLLRAQGNYPSRTIKLVVPFAAGGGPTC
jgi:tripartite-type tricarboxylate transporter receptor subunit TctC